MTTEERTKGIFDHFGLFVLASIAWVFLLVYPIHIWLTGEPHEAKVIDCSVSYAYDDTLGPTYSYLVKTDFDGKWSQYICSPKRCPTFNPAKSSAGLHPDGPNCGDSVTVFASSVSGASRVVSTPTFFGVLLSGRSDYSVIGIFFCALYSVVFILVAAVLFVDNLVSRASSFYKHVSEAKGMFVAVLETMLSTAFLVVVSILMILFMMLFFRMLLVSSLPSKFSMFTIVASASFAVAISPLPRKAVNIIFAAYHSSLASNLRHFIGMALATRFIYNLIVADMSHDPWSFDHASELVFCVAGIVLTGECFGNS